MRIAVIGAGIAGLVAGIGLQRSGHKVTIYEQRVDTASLGTGLTLFANAFRALDLLELGDLVRDVSSNDIATMRAGQRSPSGKWLSTVPRNAVSSMRSVHRADLHQALLQQLNPGTLRSGTCASVNADGEPIVTVDEDEEQCDLVIAADGIHSRSRRSLGLDPGLRYAGFTAWRGVTDIPVSIGREAGETWGRGKVFGIVPLQDGRVYWFGTLATRKDSSFANERAAVEYQFSGWHRSVGDCIGATRTDGILRHDIYDLATPLRSFSVGRVALVGDAAHAMTPNLGQGAGQAIEDAATLAHLLRKNSAKGVDATLTAYSKLRVPRTRSLWKRSRTASRVAQAANPSIVSLRNTAIRLIPGRALGSATGRLQSWHWIDQQSSD